MKPARKELEVVEASPQHIDAVVAIAQATFDWHHAQLPDEFLPFERTRVRDSIVAATQTPRHVLLVACDASETVGFVHLVIIRRPQSAGMTARRFGHIEHIAVRPDRYRQGIGHALIEAVRSHLRRESITELRAAVFEANAISSAFFDKEGFGTQYRERTASV